MRKIKFRAIRKYDWVWVYWNLIYSSEWEKHIVESKDVEKDWHHIQIHTDEPMFYDQDSFWQYIMINDRMNTEIYVWDIVKNWLSWVRVVQECKWWFELLWLDQEKKIYHFKLDALNDECMVFGNIYENPEILEEYNKIPKTKYNTDYLFPNKNNV